MNSISYKKQSVLLIIWIFMVIALFRFISEKQVAALIAGSGFVLLPILFLFSEFKNKKNKLHIGALFLFLICSSLPIFLLRILNWGVDFKTLSIAGISAEQLHQASNGLYLLVLVSSVFNWFKENKEA